MSDERVERANQFFGPLAPGLHGAVFDSVQPDRVVGHIDVTEPLIAGTGFLFAPAIISLADTLCAIGCGENIDEGQSFTTIELKTNFLSSARVGEQVVGEATPVHVGGRTHVWDVVVTNETTGRIMALFRCTQMVLDSRR
ncbi:MAG: PaaI family thioesterase [Acidimicrobiales bacterium]